MPIVLRGDSRAQPGDLAAAIDRGSRGASAPDADEEVIPKAGGTHGHPSSAFGVGGGGTFIVDLLEAAMDQRPQRAEVDQDGVADADQAVHAGRFLSLQAVSVSAHLHAELYIAFCLAGECLLRDFSDSAAGRDESARKLRMVLHGEGGTGMSRVLSCLTTLCKSWQQELA